MANLIVGIFLIIKCACPMVKTSYYHLIKDTLVEIPMEIVSVKRRNSKKFGRYYDYGYKYNWKIKRSIIRLQEQLLKKLEMLMFFLIDPRFNIIYDYELKEDDKSFFGMILMIIGIGLVLTQIL